MKYLFTSDRLGFRNWEINDIDYLNQLNSDSEVMKYFPSIQTVEQNFAFIERMRQQFEQKGFCYFAVHELQNNDIVGFIGISHQDYQSPFTPCIDIGWRLNKKYWGKGLATEGALRCLNLAFNELAISEIYSVAPVINNASIVVMQKIGMVHQYDFEHSLLKNFPQLKKCSLYKITQSGLKS